MSRGKHWITEPDQELVPTIGEKGYASKKPVTIVEAFRATVAKHGNCNALASQTKVDGKLSDWKFWSWNDYYRDCESFAKALIFLKVDKFKIINILGFNAPPWLIASNGATLAGAIGAGIYMTNNAEACHYVTEHSKAEVLVLEGNFQLKKYANVPKNKLPFLKAIVVYGEVADPALVAKVNTPVYAWDDFLKLGAEIPKAEVDARADSLNPGHCASLIYTSGTTGPPKAVMISHDNITWTAQNIIDHYMKLDHNERVVSYLPLSHIAAQLIDIYAILLLGGCTYFAQPDALKGTLTNTMKSMRPTFFFGVPRVWEKIQEKMVQIGRGITGVKKDLSTWAKGLGTEHCRLLQYGNGGGAPWGYFWAKRIVLNTIKEAIGLDQAKGCFTAAAPIAPETLNYFASLNIPVFEVFGQSECTGPHTVSFRHCWKIGTCGRPMKGTESMLAPSTGELCYRGRHIFMGYMYMPDKTAETIDDDGFLHSGDVAEFDNDTDKDIVGPGGFMRITGRIKELIITAGGENVPPVLIENEVKAAMVAVSNCMVIGDKRKFLTLLVSLKVDVDVDARPTDNLAADSLFIGEQIGSTAKLYSEAIVDPLWKDYVDKGVKTANSKTTSNAQIVQKWVWLPVDFSEKAGDLTPTLKLKRSVVAEKNAALIDSLYEGTD